MVSSLRAVLGLLAASALAGSLAACGESSRSDLCELDENCPVGQRCIDARCRRVDAAAIDGSVVVRDAALLDGALADAVAIDGPMSTPDDVGTTTFDDAASPDDAGSATDDAAVLVDAGGPRDCPALTALRGTGTDASAALAACIATMAAGETLALEPGHYAMANQVRIDRAITLTTRGLAGAPACSATGDGDCATFDALPAFDARLGILYVAASAHLDHLVLDGRRTERGGTHAHQMCSTLADNAYGFNGTLDCTSCSLTASVSRHALCGTGLLVLAPAADVTLDGNTFFENGVHTTRNLWADGLTVHDSRDSRYVNNTFIDNTDIDLIFGGCQRCTITGNHVRHTASAVGGAFAAIMIQKWPNTSGDYQGVDVSSNDVDCGPDRQCGSGFYIGSESWYPETPFGTLVDGQTSGLITRNTVTNTKNAFYIAARGLAIYGNDFTNSHGSPMRTSCDTTISSATPIIVSPTARSCHFGLENVDPVRMVQYSGANWTGCVPNFPAL